MAPTPEAVITLPASMKDAVAFNRSVRSVTDKQRTLGALQHDVSVGHHQLKHSPAGQLRPSYDGSLSSSCFDLDSLDQEPSSKGFISLDDFPYHDTSCLKTTPDATALVMPDLHEAYCDALLCRKDTGSANMLLPGNFSPLMDSRQSPDSRLYTLVLLDDVTGDPLRPATDEDADEVARLMSSADTGSSIMSSGAADSWPAFHVAGEDDLEEDSKQVVDNNLTIKQEHTAGAGADECAGGAGVDGPSAFLVPAIPGVPAVPRPFHHKGGGPCDHCGVTGKH